MLYQRVNVATGGNLGAPDNLPDAFSGLADSALADLSLSIDPDALVQLGYSGIGFFPVPDPAPDPAPVTRDLSRILFLQRMTPATRIAIRAAGRSNPIIEDFLDLISATDTINLDAADTIMGVGYMRSLGLLNEAEAAALLT